MAAQAEYRPTLKVREAALLLGVSHETLYAAIRRGELRAIKLGNRVIVPVAEVEGMLGHKLSPESLAWAQSEVNRKLKKSVR